MMSDSGSDDEPAVRYGTPLDPIEEDEIPSKRKYQQPADQYAVDSHGRRRFHGAFTGGFSAGYGNSVGTPEGWTPATFKSSRSDKAQISSRRPEDFMDEEDRGEFGIAPRQMATHSDFSGQKRRLQRYHDGPIPGEPVLEQLLKAVHETAAVKMLKAMGWKPGQGAGGRLTKAEKKRAKEQHKVYGCYMPPEMRQESEETQNKSSDDSSDSEFEYETLFAPDDYEPYVLSRKSDRFGLGYSGLSRHSVLGSLAAEYGGEAAGSRSHLVMREKGKKVSIRGQAFGVGAFEADDEDIYAKEDMSHYDFALGGAPQDKKKPPKQGGGNVLKGFVKSSKPAPRPPAHPPPALPRDYAPAVANRTRFEPTAAKARDQGLGRHDLSAEARGSLLGETPVPKVVEAPPTTSIQTDKPATAPLSKEDLLAKIAGRNVNFVSTSNEQPKELDFIPIKDSGKEVTKTFRPFISDPSKQARYELYLSDKDGYMRERDGASGAVGRWERDREMVEFEQAAKLYRPLTGVMGDRFTHGSEPADEATNPLCAVAKSGGGYGLATPEQVAAAERQVYGIMTRRRAEWRPDSLVCKRFNIPDPHGARPEQRSEDKPKVSYSIFSYLESSIHDKDSFSKEQSKFSGSKSLIDAPKVTQSKQTSETPAKETNPVASTSLDTGFSKRMTVAELFLKESEKDLQKEEPVTETIDKFDKMDLYKSIFLSDSEDETSANTNDKNKSNDVDAGDFINKPKNVERNLSPPRGIFANIDFDELNSWKRNTKTDKGDKNEPQGDKNGEKSTDKNEVKNVDKGTDSNVNEIDVYGPRIPENFKKRLDEDMEKESKDNFRPKFRSRTAKVEETVEIDSSSSSDSWVEAKEVKSKKVKKEKKKKKHKSKHKKSKHKKKDR